jgi:hypothetical protein
MLLSKSKYLVGLQCPKLLWITVNKPELIPEVSEATKHIFDQGHIVGKLAHSLYPKGINIQIDDFQNNLKQSTELLKKRKPLFEAAFSADNLYSRVDILKPAGKDEWDLIEVKSATEVKDVNLHDVSFQRYCLEKAGLKIRNCILMHINNEYVRKGRINPKQLFKLVDITSEVNETICGIQERIDSMFKIINSKTCPETRISPQCYDPYDCPLLEKCFGFLPENNIFNLYSGGKKCFELFEQGVYTIKDIHMDFELTERQAIQKNCEKTGKTHINKEGIKDFLNKLKYPIYYLDFETYGTAIPLYDGIKPYQQIPFQFSLHIQDKNKLIHHSFLAKGAGDPRKQFISQLKKVLGTKGSIVVYNQGFEQDKLVKLAKAFPKYKKWVDSVVKRMVDLLLPFRNFHYYNPEQQGSASLKSVLPALTGKSYEGMEIAEGGTAPLRYLFITHGASDGRKATPKEVKEIRHNLELYCGLDTEGMVWIVDELRKLVE